MAKEELNKKLLELDELLLKKTNLKRRRDTAYSEVDQKQKEINLHNKVIMKEQKDVTDLQTFTFKNVFTTILGTKSEKLSEEQKELLDASLKKDGLNEEYEDLKEEYETLNNAFNKLPDYEQMKKNVLKTKEELLKETSIVFKEQYDLHKQKINNSKQQLIEIEQALSLGRSIVRLLESAHSALKSAQKYHAWDTWTKGGIINHTLKHDALASANKSILLAKRRITTFNKELKDVIYNTKITTTSYINVNKSLDFWFDNIFTNFQIRDQIANGLSQVSSTSIAIQKALEKLRTLEIKHTNTFKEHKKLLNKLISEY